MAENMYFRFANAILRAISRTTREAYRVLALPFGRFSAISAIGYVIFVLLEDGCDLRRVSFQVNHHTRLFAEYTQVCERMTS